MKFSELKVPLCCCTYIRSRLRCRTCARWCSRFHSNRSTLFTKLPRNGDRDECRFGLRRGQRLGQSLLEQRVHPAEIYQSEAEYQELASHRLETGILVESVWNMLYLVLAKGRFKDVKWYDVTSTLNLGEVMRMTDVVLFHLNSSTVQLKTASVIWQGYLWHLHFVVSWISWLGLVNGFLQSWDTLRASNSYRLLSHCFCNCCMNCQWFWRTMVLLIVTSRILPLRVGLWPCAAQALFWSLWASMFWALFFLSLSHLNAEEAKSVRLRRAGAMHTVM